MEQVRFALTGAAGYIAPRHYQAIKETGNTLLAAMDISDSVGILDQYFPECSFFTEFERFDRYIDKLRRRGDNVDYLSICSPNYLHDSHVRFALHSGSNAICEKPLTLNPHNIDALVEIENQSKQSIHTILQLRLHPSIIAIKDKIMRKPDKIYDVDLTYITSRGNWYLSSWKGNIEKSGGIATNIGVHFFDMLYFLFGNNTRNTIHHHAATKAAGYLEFERARVRWFLSIDRNDLPKEIPAKQSTFRSIVIDEEEIEFSSGFTDLHTLSYQEILKGNGFNLKDVYPSIQIVSAIRTQKIELHKEEQHPLLQK